MAQGVHRCALAAAADAAAVPPSAGTYCARAASQSVSHRLHHHHRRRRIWSRAPPTFDRRLCPSSRCRRDCDKNPRILQVSQRVQTNTWRLCGASGGASNQRGPSGRPPAVPRLQYSPSLAHSPLRRRRRLREGDLNSSGGREESPRLIIQQSESQPVTSVRVIHPEGTDGRARDEFSSGGGGRTDGERI